MLCLQFNGSNLQVEPHRLEAKAPIISAKFRQFEWHNGEI